MNFSITSLLRRKTSGGNFIPEIDGLRFFAIFTVLIFHLNTAFSRELNLDWPILLPVESFSQIGWWIIRMDLGVKVFFGISGFILAVPFILQHQYNGKKVSLKQYFIRRITRLEPPFIITLILFSFIHIYLLNADTTYIIKHFTASLLYMHTIIYENPSIINPVTWSLETEVQFYIIIPFLSLLIFFRKNSIWISSLIFLLILGSFLAKNYIYTHTTPGWDYTIFVFLSNFLMGFIFALIYLKYRTFFSSKSYIFDFLGLLSIFTLFFFYKPQFLLYNNLIFNISIFCLFICTFKGKLFNLFFTLPIIYLIGGMCYTIYLIHYPLFHLWVKFSKLLIFDVDYFYNLLIQLIIGIPIAILVSSIFFILVEKPCMDKDWPKKLKSYLFEVSNIR